MFDPQGLIQAGGNFDHAHGAPAAIQKLTTAVTAELDAIDRRIRLASPTLVVPASLPGILLFRAVKGRVYHGTDQEELDHAHGTAIAICGAEFEHWYDYRGRGAPTCPKCRAILADRVAVQNG